MLFLNCGDSKCGENYVILIVYSIDRVPKRERERADNKTKPVNEQENGMNKNKKIRMQQKKNALPTTE